MQDVAYKNIIIDFKMSCNPILLKSFIVYDYLSKKHERIFDIYKIELEKTSYTADRLTDIYDAFVFAQNRSVFFNFYTGLEKCFIKRFTKLKDNCINNISFYCVLCMVRKAFETNFQSLLAGEDHIKNLSENLFKLYTTINKRINTNFEPSNLVKELIEDALIQFAKIFPDKTDPWLNKYLNSEAYTEHMKFEDSNWTLI